MNTRPGRSLLSWLATSLLLGCGGGVVVDRSPSDGAGGGGAGPGGGGATSVSATGAGGAPEPVTCGGRGGNTCGDGELCDFRDDTCGANDGQGLCASRPEGCPEDCPGVCGCDGQFYCNACSAHAAGVDVSALASCSPEGGGYSAIYWAGGLDHLVVRKADPMLNLCVQLFIDAPSENGPGMDIELPSGWGVSHALMSASAEDCVGEARMPRGETALVDVARGTLRWEAAPNTIAPCVLDVDVVAQLGWPTPGFPSEARLEARGVRVPGGCF